ncbi:MAG: class C sortase [Lachnospiraceae bacterium]|nr:class C sortase [Lachnospiraceae bacterium]
MKRVLGRFVLILLFLVGLGIALYPVISNQFNLYRASKLISYYQKETGEIPAADYSDILEACRAYNNKVGSAAVADAFSNEEGEASAEYMALLNMDEQGMMGTIEIPRIGVKIPIYHTTKDEVLQNGAGHMEGSSLPVGGEDTHSVLAAHRGLPSAKLFSDLDQVEVGDFFYINVLNETLIYEVEEILVVEPQETGSLSIQRGRDLVTLVTCTPYAINTHRLLVRGKRIFQEEISRRTALLDDAVKLPQWKDLLLYAVPLFVLLYVIGRIAEWRRGARISKKLKN